MAEINQAIVAGGGNSTASFVFRRADQTAIPQNEILNGIKAMFGNAVLPWNGCLTANHILAILRHFGVEEPAQDPRLGHTSGFPTNVLSNMKNRIVSIKQSLTKVMLRLNREANVAAAQLRVTTEQQATTAAATATAYENGVADGLAQAAQQAADAADQAGDAQQRNYFIIIVYL